VSGFETLRVNGDGIAVNLTAPLPTGMSTIDLTGDANDQDLTLGTGYTGATTVKIAAVTGDADSVVNSANVALTVEGLGNAFNNATITGGTGTDVLKMSVDSAGSTASLVNVTNVETINLAATLKGLIWIAADLGAGQSPVSTVSLVRFSR